MTAYGKAIAVEVAVEDNQRYASNRLKTVRRIVAGCVAAFAGACVVYIIAIAPFRPWPLLWSRMYDDFAYYLQIGRNYADGLGLTFDGRNPTNGFMPLWQALVAVMQMALPFQDQPEKFVRAVLVLQGVLLAAAFVVFNQTLRFLNSQLLRWLGIVLFLTIVCLRFRNGMESPLLVLLAVVVVYFHAQNGALDRWSKWHCVGFGALLGGVLLARLDSVFWLIGIFATLILMSGSNDGRSMGTRLRRSSWIGLTCVAVMVPYLAGNYLAYGHLTPISGALKSSFPVPGYYLPAWTLWGEASVLVLVAVILSIACLIWEFGPWQRTVVGPLRGPACAMAIGVLLHVGYEAFFMKWGVYPWHFALEHFAVCLLLPYLCLRIASVLPPGLRRWAIGGIGAIAVILASTASAAVIYREWIKIGGSWGSMAYQAAQWVKGDLPDNAVIAMGDAGTMGFFSDRPVVNLDGLVNSFDYQEAIKNGRFREFLRNSGVNYYAQVSFLGHPGVISGEYSDYPVFSYSPLYEKRAEEFRLARSDEVYRLPYYSDGPDVLVIWRIPPEDLGGGPTDSRVK